MGHVILLGDSIFDNAAYVPGGPPVVDQLRGALPRGWRVTLLAVDGDMTKDVTLQLAKLPADATHLIVSVGGNDALTQSGVLDEPVVSVRDALRLVRELCAHFTDQYRGMLRALTAVRKPAAVCTVYDCVPGLGPPELTALACFNEAILREAFLASLPVVDLRLVCREKADYSEISPIEPSATGGEKIVRAIARLVTAHDFSNRSSIYS